MKFLAISGSARRLSTNTHMLRAISQVSPSDIEIAVFDRIGDLPVFSPDLEGNLTPQPVRVFRRLIAESDGLIVSSPEYVRSIPGGLKNAIDWLVSGEELVGKPVALAHASHRGEDMLRSLRTVLATVTSNFNPAIFLRVPLLYETPEDIARIVNLPGNRQRVAEFLCAFADYCRMSAANNS